MLFLLIVISSGLFLGWLLGAKDTVNLFGSPVSTKMLNIKNTALIASIFIILGAVFQGHGTSMTINNLSNIEGPAASFIVALSAALIVLLLGRINLPVSTSQTIVGSILGFAFFSNSFVQQKQISEIVFAWILSPFLGLLISAGLFVLLRIYIKKSQIHLIKLDFYLRIGLMVGIALSAFGLGANNIGNVIGVFANFKPSFNFDFGFIYINGLQILFAIGAISIAAGIYTYSYRSGFRNQGSTLSLMPEATIVVLFSQAIVLFLFSSNAFASALKGMGLPAFPLVPVSSTQIVVGSVLGIGLIKGAREISTKSLAGIGIGWITAPLGAAILSFMTFYILQKVFGISLVDLSAGTDLKHSGIFNGQGKGADINMVLPGIMMVSALGVSVSFFLFFRQQKLRLKVEKDMLIQQNELHNAQKAMNELEMKTIAMENAALNFKLQAKRKEFIDIALNINEQREFLEILSSGIHDIMNEQDTEARNQKLRELSLLIKQKMSFSSEKREFYVQIEEVHRDFHLKLKNTFPNLTDIEKRLAGLLRLNLSNKEISSLLNISTKSVEVSRYRLKKKMNLNKEETLTQFINNL
jgi:inorganic phosphate transporter, PiT family